MEFEYFLRRGKYYGYHMARGWGNGYVIVPKDHPLAGNFGTWDPQVHGGVTYNNLVSRCRFIPKRLDPLPDSWVVGFDTAHYFDNCKDQNFEFVFLETLHLKLQLEAVYQKSNRMRDLLEKVEEFNKAFKQSYNKENPGTIDISEYRLRHRLMEEENNEYLDACRDGNLVEIADALGDQLYILCGTILKHGLQDKITQVFNEIHSSNMSKLSEDGEPLLRPDGKIMKGPQYSPPNIKNLIQ